MTPSITLRSVIVFNLTGRTFSLTASMRKYLSEFLDGSHQQRQQEPEPCESVASRPLEAISSANAIDDSDHDDDDDADAASPAWRSELPIVADDSGIARFPAAVTSSASSLRTVRPSDLTPEQTKRILSLLVQEQPHHVSAAASRVLRAPPESLFLLNDCDDEQHAAVDHAMGARKEEEGRDGDVATKANDGVAQGAGRVGAAMQRFSQPITSSGFSASAAEASDHGRKSRGAGGGGEAGLGGSSPMRYFTRSTVKNDKNNSTTDASTDMGGRRGKRQRISR